MKSWLHSIRARLSSAYRRFLPLACLPVFLGDFFASETGAACGVGRWQKLRLALRMIRNNRRIESGSSYLEHLVMAGSILRLSPSTPGVVVECGAYKGASAANLSLVCALAGRRLEVFDSFQGLPEPTAEDRGHTLLGAEEVHEYESGWWRGSLDEVRDNIRRFGAIEVCGFHQGLFDDTLPEFDAPVAQAWIDVDYRDSLETCVRHLWPLLRDGCYLYTHEATHTEIAELFYSQVWWSENLREVPPGLVGAGTGLGFRIDSGSYFTSPLGFTIKNPRTESFDTIREGGVGAHP